MKNPWSTLPTKKPFILPCDKAVIQQFNLKRSSNKTVKTTLLPEPFLGNPRAQVVILGLNPGFSKRAVKQHRRHDFIKRLRENLVHRYAKDANCPLYLIDEKLLSDPNEPGRKWWDRALRKWIDDPDIGRQAVAHGVFCIEFFPYHSKSFGHSRVKLESQRYSFSLVRRAIKRGATIIILWGGRCNRNWKRGVPDLINYSRCFKLKNPRHPVISKKNCRRGYLQGAEALRQVASKLKRAASRRRA